MIHEPRVHARVLINSLINWQHIRQPKFYVFTMQLTKHGMILALLILLNEDLLELRNKILKFVNKFIYYECNEPSSSVAIVTYLRS